MRGKTKGFLEDIIIIVTILAIIYGIYNLFTSDSRPENQTTININKVENNQTKLKIDTKKIVTTQQHTNNSNKPVIKEEKTVQVKTKQEPEKKKLEVKSKIENKEIKISINKKKLLDFMIKTQYDIRKYIVRTNPTNKMKFRLTILEDGNYEKLTFISGDKQFFYNNKENIIKIFPLNIHNDIKNAFPRYFTVDIKAIPTH